MKADTILRLHAERCCPTEIALALRMSADNVRRVIQHQGWPRYRRDRRSVNALRLLATVRA